MKSFSQRHSHQKPVPIAVRDSAPEAFRLFLIDTLQHYLHIDYRNDSSEFVFVSLGKVPRISWRAARNEMLGAPWFKIYDLLEGAHARVCVKSSERAENLRTLVNNFFENNGYAYKLSEAGHIEHRGGESFEAAIDRAYVALTEAGLLTAENEIHKALENLSQRPIPDLTGAVQHAMAGLECAAKHLSGESKLELGKITKRYPDLFPPPLGEVVAQLYGFASNNGRHLVEGGAPNFSEAELIVGIAATTAAYLARKIVN
jgi:hypothetical protein